MATAAPIATRQRGAALLLLLVVLGMAAASVIIGALGGPASDQRRQQATLVELGLAREALIGYALRNGRLPRPASSAQDGRERPLPCADARACTGFVPWVTLGITGADAWGKRLRYSVTPALSVRGFDVASTVADKRIMTRDADGELVYKVGQPGCEVAAQCLPAVVYSSGSKNLGASVGGQAQANGALANRDEIYNDSAANDFISRAMTADPAATGGEFDDVMSWITLPAMYQQMARAGTLQARQ